MATTNDSFVIVIHHSTFHYSFFVIVINHSTLLSSVHVLGYLTSLIWKPVKGIVCSVFTKGQPLVLGPLPKNYKHMIRVSVNSMAAV